MLLIGNKTSGKKWYHDLVKDVRILLVSITMLISLFANATTCPNATVITGSQPCHLLQLLCLAEQLMI